MMINPVAATRVRLETDVDTADVKSPMKWWAMNR